MTIRTVVGAAVFCLALCATSAAIADSATPSNRGPSGCPPEVDPKKFVCFTISEAEQIDLRLQSLKADRDLAQSLARARKPRLFGRPYANVGVEFLPNDQTTVPYAIGGFNIGPVGVWGGLFGSTPAVGIGFKF